jgi:hypothetical protein
MPRKKLTLSLVAAAFVAIAGVAIAPTFAATRAAAPAPATATDASTVGILSDNAKPKVTADFDRSPVELGIRFSPTTSGEVTALQFYQTGRSSDVQQATLWAENGTALARQKFKPSTTVGWRTVALSKPVSVTKGDTYVASYHAANGRYAATHSASWKAKTANGFIVKTGAGVFRYGKASKMPHASYRDSNYFVDVVLKPGKNWGSTPPAPPVTTKPAPPVTAPPTTQPAPPTTQPAPPVTQPAPPVTQPAPPVTQPAPPVTAGFPTAATTGIPSGWAPKTKVTGDYWVRTDGAVVQDLQITNGAIHVAAKNVTLRRISGTDASVTNYNNGVCSNGLKIEDSSFVIKSGTTDSGDPVIGPGGYTVSNVLIDGAPEGLRVGGKGLGCGDVNVTKSFVRIAAPQVCNDWHGDGIQGYDGGRLVVRNSTIIMNESSTCQGTAPFFYPAGQGNTSIDVDGLIVSGAGYPFRSGMPGTVKNLNVVQNSWGYGPISVKCSAISSWQASIATLNSAGQPVVTKPLACTTETNG